MTEITVQQMQAMTDGELVLHLKRFPYRSQYVNQDAYQHAEYRVALMQGARYMATGNTKAFTNRPA